MTVDEFLALKPTDALPLLSPPPAAAPPPMTMSVDEFLALPSDGAPPTSPAVASPAEPQGPVPRSMEPPRYAPGGALLEGLAEQAPPPKTFGEQLMELPKSLRKTTFGPGGILGPETSLGTAGGLAGFAVGGPVGAVVGGGLGSGIGKGVDILWGVEPGQETPSAREMAPDIAWSTGLGAVTEIPAVSAGKYLGKSAAHVLSPFVNKADMALKAAVDIAEKRGIPLTAAQRTGSKILRGLEAIPERYSLFSGPGERFAQGQLGELQRNAEAVAKSMSPAFALASEEVGRSTIARSFGRLGAAKRIASGFFDGVNKLIAPDAQFATNRIFGRAAEVLKDEAVIRGVPDALAGTVHAAARLPNMPTVNAKDVGGVASAIIREFHLDDPSASKMTFERMLGLRTKLGELWEVHGGTPEGRQIARMFHAVDQDIADVGKVVPAATKMLEDGRKYYREEVIGKYLKNPTYKKLQKADASTVVSMMMPDGVSVEEVRRLKSTLSTKEFDKLKAGWMNNIIGVRSGADAGEFSVSGFLNATKRYSPEVQKEIMGNSYKDFKEVRDIFTLIERSRGKGGVVSTGSSAAANKQILDQVGKLGLNVGAKGAIFLGLGGVSNPILAGAVAGLSPALIAKLMFSEKGIRFLAEGLKPGKITKGIEGLTTLGAMIAKSQVDSPFEEDKVPALSPGEVKTPNTPVILNPQQGVPIEMGRAFGGGR